jgi:hypothetical protein
MTDSDQKARGNGRSGERAEPNGDHPRRIDRHIAYFGDRITTPVRTGRAAERSSSERRSPPASP